MPKRVYKRAKTNSLQPYGSTTNKRFTSTPRTGQNYSFVPRVPGNPMSMTERKYYDQQVASKTIQDIASDWTNTECDPTPLSLFTPTQGTNYLNRIGRKVLLKSIRVHGHVTLPASSNTSSIVFDNPVVVRLILYQDKQTNGVQSQGESVIASGTNTVAINMFQNPQNFGRYRVLKDKKMTLKINAAVFSTDLSQSGEKRVFNWNIRFRKPLIVNFNSGNAENVSDIVDHSFHIIAGIDVASTLATLNYKSRCVFIDN